MNAQIAILRKKRVELRKRPMDSDFGSELVAVVESWLKTSPKPQGLFQNSDGIQHGEQPKVVEGVVRSASVVELVDYYPYGGSRLDERSGSFDEKRKFTGHEFDSDTGLYYMNARYQSPTTGRFISQDELFWQMPKRYLLDPQSQNSYAYARNNPITFIDVDGNEWSWAAVGRGLNQSWQGISGTGVGIGQGFYSLGAGAYNTVRHPVDTYNGTVDLVANGMLAGQDLYQGFSTNPGGTFGEIAGGIKQGVIEESQKSTFEQTRGAAKFATEVGVPIAAGIALKGLSAGSANSEAGNFFNNARYSQRVLDHMADTKDLYHAFPDLVKTGASNGTLKTIMGGDGLKYQQLNIPGSINGTSGNFEFIKGSNGVITHRLFSPTK